MKQLKPTKTVTLVVIASCFLMSVVSCEKELVTEKEIEVQAKVDANTHPAKETTPSSTAETSPTDQENDRQAQELIAALSQLSFMNAKQGFSCQKLKNGFDVALASQAIRYFQEHEYFSNNYSGELENNRTIANIALKQLNSVVDSLLTKAQYTTYSFSQKLNPIGQIEQSLAVNSSNMGRAMPNLIALLNYYKQFGFENSLKNISQCFSAYANEQLQAATTLADEAKLYQLTLNKNFSATDTSSAYFIESSAQSSDYLHQQVQRTMLVAQYAEPFVSFLLNIPDSNNTQDEESLEKWRQTLNQLYLYEQNTNNQINHLETFIHEGLRELNQQNCRKILNKWRAIETGEDIFSLRRLALQEKSQSLCNTYTGQASSTTVTP